MSEQKEPAEGENQKENQKDVYELIIPPGVPSKVIIAASKKFDLDVTKVSASVETAFEEAISRELLAFRADRETIEKIRDFLIEETTKFIEE
ncbi:MAG TPA: hypothetical protein VEG44_08345 [Candidatus Acidoferrales bacterium]|nr:hypothetical protein [Candidatus Acidoferrales bacterium]